MKHKFSVGDGHYLCRRCMHYSNRRMAEDALYEKGRQPWRWRVTSVYPASCATHASCTCPGLLSVRDSDVRRSVVEFSPGSLEHASRGHARTVSLWLS